MGLKGSDCVVQNPPAWLPGPVYRWLADLTYDEWHMMVLGLACGVFVAGGYLAGPILRVLAAVSVVGMGVITVRKCRSAGPTARLISQETWYFAVPFAATTLLLVVAARIIM